MKKELVKRLLIILLLMAVVTYLIYSYMSGRIQTPYFMILLALMSYILISGISRLVSDLRKH